MNHDIFPSPVKLLSDAVTNFNPKLDDPLTFTVKIWQNTVCGFEQKTNSDSEANSNENLSRKKT